MQNHDLASFAMQDYQSRGRLFSERETPQYRATFGLDCERVINSSAFRRLQYKTQVFVNHQGDHYRTRLTHTLEMAQIARWLAESLKVNRDLAEVISLAHDLGHPPFGHAGEDALNDKIKNCIENNCDQNNAPQISTNSSHSLVKNFSHNTHTLKIVTKIETRFIEFEGLNLSFETLEGLVKHNGALLDSAKTDKYILNFNQIFDLELTKNPTLEAQISAIADDIAYNNHDIEDGLRAGLFDIKDFFEESLRKTVVGKVYQEILENNPNIRQELLVGEAKKRITSLMVIDVIKQTQDNLQKNNIKTLEDIRNYPRFLVEFSWQMSQENLAIKNFLMTKMYRHKVVNDMTLKAREVIDCLFDYHLANPALLPKERYEKYLQNKNLQNLIEITCDYIAGMTDRFAISLAQTIKT